MQYRIISRRGMSLLVEYDDGALHRVVIPVEEVGENGEITMGTLSMGIPYGADWEAKIQALDLPAAIAGELRRAGFWTEEDVQKRPGDALLILRRRSVSLNDILREA